MTRSNARLTAFIVLSYVATAAMAMMLFDGAAAGGNTAARLTSIAQHVPQMRLVVALSLVSVLDALILAVALYGSDVATIALSCCLAEGAIGAAFAVAMRLLLWMATAAAAMTGEIFGPLLFKAIEWSGFAGATVFIAGSVACAWTVLRTRTLRQEPAHV
jgi:hypothetical protein